MNKLKSIFCAAFLFIVCAVMCVGCSININGNINETGNSGNTGTGNQETPVVSTITLAEAETLITNALTIDNNQSNRNLFEKLGKFKISMNTNTFEPELEENYHKTSIEGYVEYADGASKVYHVNEFIKNFKTGNSDSEKYLINGVEYKKDINTNEITYSSHDSVMLAVSHSFNSLLSEQAFDHVLKDDVERVATTNDGFTLNLKTDLKGALQIVVGDYSENFESTWHDYQTELKKFYTQKDLDECYALIKLNFSKYGNIIGADFELIYLALSGNNACQQEMYVSVNKTISEITQPEWVTEYLEN